MWTLLQSSSHTAIDSFNADTKYVNYTMKYKMLEYRLLFVTDVFLGIFSRHFVNRFIYMQIYNFSLCKEVKDNHLNVVL